MCTEIEHCYKENQACVSKTRLIDKSSMKKSQVLCILLSWLCFWNIDLEKSVVSDFSKQVLMHAILSVLIEQSLFYLGLGSLKCYRGMEA